MELLFDTRTDYTFKYNAHLGRHGWLRLTPAYSVKLVHSLLKDCKPGERILDPFSGTGTTGIVAAERGLEAVSLDINPFLIWLGNTKSSNFSIEQIQNLKADVASIVLCLTPDGKDYWVPPIHNIERWWDSGTLQTLSKLRWLIANTCGEPTPGNPGNLVWAAFCRLVIETSAAAFNHVSMSFKNGTKAFDQERLATLFQAIFNYIAKSVMQPLPGKSEMLEMDSRDPRNAPGKFDRIVTSPPYPNRISYIRELRPYMYWSKFLHNGSDAGELDWKAMGGTWGIATSRLKNWQPTQANLPDFLHETCANIESPENANGDLMARYVHKFFEDLAEHIKNVRPILNPGSSLHYVIGNSSFYGVFVHTEKILADILQKTGYSNITTTPIRKRNSKKGLIEFCVSAKWNG